MGEVLTALFSWLSLIIDIEPRPFVLGLFITQHSGVPSLLAGNFNGFSKRSRN